jgi:hypothetical protein
MYKKRINCQSCEIKCDVIVRESNFDDELEVEYCPFCSVSIDDNDYGVDEDE